MSRSVCTAALRAAAVSFLAVSASACDITLGAHEYQVREEKRFAVTGVARVSLATFDGSVEVRGWDRAEVLIEVEKRGPDQATADAITVDARQEGGVITVDIRRPSGVMSGNWRTSPGARIVASVPLQSDLVVRSGDGSVTVERVNGRHDIKTEDGSVRADDVKGSLVVRTDDGSVRVDDVEGSVDAETGDGSITVDGVVTGVQLETNDGTVHLTARDGSAMASDWFVSTGDGSVRAELPKGFGAEMDAESADGRVRVEGLPSGATRDNFDGGDPDERRRARGTIGAGGKSLKLRTGSGSVIVQVG